MNTDRNWAGTRMLAPRAVFRRVALLAGLLLAFAGTASAGNLCMTLGSNDYVGIGGSIPGKGACKQFSIISPTVSGFLGTGSVCKSSDGTTLLFFMTDGVFSGPETLQATLSATSLAGTGQDCEAPAGLATFCGAFSMTFQKCIPAKQPIPAISGSSLSGTAKLATEP